MGSLPSAHPQTEVRDFRRNPVICVAFTLILSAIFWAGLIWAAVRLYG